ncbi:MAG TPA: hypothetical protein VFH80_24765 [Solirubrobacteraceae bacterium]|nr:hypothetical protein [Solirubrobacteraceae bacterium]
MAAPALALVATAALAAGAGGEIGGRTILLFWPAGAPEFVYPSGGSGRTVAVAEPSSDRRSVRLIPGIAPGDFPVALLPVGRWLVYNGDRGVSAIASTFSGRPHVLGRAAFFVPAGVAGHVLLVRTDRSTGRPVSVQSVSVLSGKSAPPRRLPAGTLDVVEGSATGLVLVSQRGAVQTWTPGRSRHMVANLHGLREDAGIASDPRFLVYASGCAIKEATSGFPRTPVGYHVCAALNIVNLVRLERRTFPAPPGTIGWTPAGFGANAGIAPDDTMLAASAATAPANKGRAQLFLLRLRGGGGTTAVPQSTARLYARTAWSRDGAWLFYQGPGERLRALNIQSGKSYSRPLRCCQYTAMLAITIRR